MRRGQFVVAAILALVSYSAWFYLSPTKAQQGGPYKAKSIVVAADGAYQAANDRFFANKATVEDVYLWSQRLMKAQEADGKHPNAKADHLSRMENLQELITERYKSGVPGIDKFELSATSFYVLEAGGDTKK